MIERKAKFLKVCKKNPFDRKAWERTDLAYEYRGHVYIVTRFNNGYSNGSLVKQHKREQEEIDKLIEEQNKPKPEWKYEGSAQEAFDKWYDELNN